MSQTNESATVAKTKNFRELNKALGVNGWPPPSHLAAASSSSSFLLGGRCIYEIRIKKLRLMELMCLYCVTFEKNYIILICCQLLLRCIMTRYIIRANSMVSKIQNKSGVRVTAAEPTHRPYKGLGCAARALHGCRC